MNKTILCIIPLLLAVVSCQSDSASSAKPAPPPVAQKPVPAPAKSFADAGGGTKITVPPAKTVEAIGGGVRVEPMDPEVIPPAPPEVKPEPPPLPLPAAPKVDAMSTHTALLPDETLILETKPDGSKRLLVQCEVCLREGPLELFLCKTQSKEHESVLRTAVEAKFLHAALESCGAKPGAPVQFVNPKTEQPEYKSASGSKIAVSVYFTRDGKPVTERAQEWIEDIRTKKPMEAEFVFAGSRLVANSDKPNEPKVYTADLGDVISVSNKRDSMLDLPIRSTDADVDLLFAVRTEKVPPLGSKVWMILEPMDVKKK